MRRREWSAAVARQSDGWLVRRRGTRPRHRLVGLRSPISSLASDGRPAEATFRFDVPLESSTYL